MCSTISREEFKRVMTQTGSKALDDTDFDIVLREVDKNGNGVVDFNEFKLFCLKVSRFCWRPVSFPMS